MTTASVLPAAIDYLVAQLPAALQPVDPLIVVADNIPTSQVTSSLLAIGREAPQLAGVADSLQQFKVLGRTRIDEEWVLPNFIRALGGNQSAARLLAFELFGAVVDFLRDDPMLGGLIQGGYFAQVSHVAYTQPQDAADFAGDLWTATVGFGIDLPNAYYPV